MAWDSATADNVSRRSASQSDVAPRSVNRRVLRSDDALFAYDDDAVTPVGSRRLASNVVLTKKLIDNSDSPYTIDYATDHASVYRVDPTDGATTITLEDPATFPEDLPLRIENRHYGNGIVSYGDCENTAEPILVGDLGNDNYLSNATFARSDTVAHGGTYSYKVTKSVAAGTDGFAMLHDNTSDLHGLTAGATYTMTCWMYTPTTGGPSSLAEVFPRAYDVTNTTILAQALQTSYDAWQRLSFTFTIPSSCSNLYLYFPVASAAADTEFVYVDDIQLYRHYDVTVSGAIEDQTSKILHNEGDYIILVSDGDKYLIQDLQYYGRVRDAVYLGGGEYQFPADSELDYSSSFTDGMSAATVTFTELPRNTNKIYVEFQFADTGTYPYLSLKRASSDTNAFVIGARFADGGTNQLFAFFWIPTYQNSLYVAGVQADIGSTFVIHGYKVGE